MLQALSEHLLAADRDREVRVDRAHRRGPGLLRRARPARPRSSGPKGSLGGLGTLDTNPGELELRDAPPVVLHNLDTPTICALNGGAAGYGLDLALGCDLRIAGESAKLNPGFAKRGILPESGGTWLLPRMVGYPKAAEIAFTGRTLLAKEALELGLVNRVVPDAELGPATAELAGEIAANAPARGAGHQAHDAHGRDRDVRAERPPRLPPAAAAVPHAGLPGGCGRLHREAPRRSSGAVDGTSAGSTVGSVGAPARFVGWVSIIARTGRSGRDRPVHATSRAPLHLRSVDRRATGAAIPSASRCGRRSTRSRRSTSWPSSAPTA